MRKKLSRKRVRPEVKLAAVSLSMLCLGMTLQDLNSQGIRGYIFPKNPEDFPVETVEARYEKSNEVRNEILDSINTGIRDDSCGCENCIRGAGICCCGE